MPRFERSIKTLESAVNEPLNWLVGDALREQAKRTTGSNFLLDALERPRSGQLTAWNAWIHRFRELVSNPDAAPIKAGKDLRADKSEATDADDKLRALVAEVQTPIVLGRRGFTHFSIIMPSQVPLPDFTAEFEGRKARIEVKNLREPKDVIRNIAADEWVKRREDAPNRYDFGVILRHAHRGSISKKAEARLRMIIGQLPKMTTPIKEILDGDVAIRIERLSETHETFPYNHILSEVAKNRPKGRLVVTGSMTPAHFKFNVTELQSLFLKALKPIVNSTSKFFGDSFNNDVLNVVALRWEPPDPLIDADMVSYTQGKIEALFAAFDLSLRVIIFTNPEIPWELLKRYK